MKARNHKTSAPGGSWGLFVALVSAFWLLAGLTEGVWYSLLRFTKEGPVDLGVLSLYMISFWGFAALLSPLLISVARRFTFERGRLWRPAAVHLVTMVLFSAIHSVVRAAWIRALVEHKPLGVLPPADLLKITIKSSGGPIMVYAGVMFATYGWDYYQRYRERARAAAALEVEQARLRASLSEARLEALQAQLQPHFLFNALHALSTLILDGEKQAANEIVTDLSRFLRMTLDTADSPIVPLAVELRFLDAYLRIQKKRFEDNLHVTLEIQEDARSASVPNLILQPLVENSVRHGIGSIAAVLTIVIRASVHDRRLKLEVEDNGRGLQNGDTPGTGLGLHNVRERLEHLYPGAYSFVLADGPTGGTLATIVIPFRSAEPQAEAFVG
jgi:predicted negative regulator of RcsB-dependent stress response